MRSSTSAPDFDEIGGDSSNSERLHFTKKSTFRTTTVTYDQQVYIKKVKWYQRDNRPFYSSRPHIGLVTAHTR